VLIVLFWCQFVFKRRQSRASVRSAHFYPLTAQESWTVSERANRRSAQLARVLDGAAAKLASKSADAKQEEGGEKQIELMR